MSARRGAADPSTGAPPPRWPGAVAAWLDLFVKIGAVFAAVFAVHQYLEARQDQRVARALDYVEQFNDAGTAAGGARQVLSTAVWANAGQIETLRRIIATLPPDEARRLLERFEKKILSDRAVDESFHMVLQFFDGLEICVASGLCDEDATLAFFGGYVATIWGNFERTIRIRRRLDPDYGSGLQRLASRGGHDPEDFQP